MDIKSKWNTFVRQNRDAASLSVYKMRALTNRYEAYHGDFAYVAEQDMVQTDEFPEVYPQNNHEWNMAFVQ